MPLPPQSGGPASGLCAAAGPGWRAGGPGPWGCCWAIPPGCGRRHGERGRAGSVLGWGGGLQEGKGQPRIGWGRVRGGSAAGGGAGVPTRGRGSPGGEGLFRGATPAGGGSLSAARRRDPDKGDGGGRRPLCGKRVSPPPYLHPTVACSSASWAGRRAPPDTSRFLKTTVEAGVLAALRVVRGAPGVGGGDGVWRRLARIWQVGKPRTGRSIWCRVPSAVTARRGHDWVSWSPVSPTPVRQTGVVSPAVVPPPAVTPWAKPFLPPA